MAAIAARGRLTMVAESGVLTVRPAGARAVERFAAEVVLAVAAAQAAGTWARLKACHHCSWLFYDSSKNRSGRWCSMTACGGRQKMRAYRRRRASALSDAEPTPGRDRTSVL
jgi:predicted RNA-binding Zn ribbon-like protein